MKVLQVSKFYPPVRGGIESTVRELAEGLMRHGVHVDVMCANDRAGTTVERLGGCQVTRVGSWGQVLSTSMAPALIGHLQRACAHYDILHLHMPDPMAALALRAAARRARHCRVVIHWHSDVIRQRWSKRAYEPLQEWLLGRADAVIATSADYAEASADLRRWRSKVAVVPIGIGDNARLAASAAESVRRRHGAGRLVLAVGRCAYYKGFEYLIQAATELPDDTAVLIAGSGGDAGLQRRLQLLAEDARLHGRVRLIGELDDSALLEHYAACDVFCLPSTHRSEAFGVAQLEAMRAGKPVVSTAIPGSGVPWVNRDGETGLTVPVGDAPALAGALRTLLADEELRTRMGQAARARYESEFTSARMIDRTLRLYRRLDTAAPPHPKTESHPR